MGIDYTLIGEGMKQIVPWIRASNLEFERIDETGAVVFLPDTEDTRNHVGGPHAAMIFGVAETAAGAVVMANFAELLGRATALVVSAEIRYRRVARGDLRATAVLTRPADEVRAELADGRRPEFPVRVTVTSADDTTVAEVTVVWTLNPDRRSGAAASGPAKRPH